MFRPDQPMLLADNLANIAPRRIGIAAGVGAAQIFGNFAARLPLLDLIEMGFDHGSDELALRHALTVGDALQPLLKFVAEADGSGHGARSSMYYTM
jgi:hypothetical protein